MPILVLVEKVVRLFCLLAGLIMSLPARTTNKTSLNYENLMNFVAVAIVFVIVLGQSLNKGVNIWLA